MYAQTHKPRWKVIFFCIMLYIGLSMKQASSWDYGTTRTCNQRRLRRACTSAQSCQGHKCSHTRNVDEGGVEARPPENSLDNVCFSHQLILQFTEWTQWFYYRGEEGVQLLPGGGGVQRNPYNLWFSRGGGGSGPPNPPLDPHVGWPDATVCLQNLGLSKF